MWNRNRNTVDIDRLWKRVDDLVILVNKIERQMECDTDTGHTFQFRQVSAIDSYNGKSIVRVEYGCDHCGKSQSKTLSECSPAEIDAMLLLGIITKNTLLADGQKKE